MPGDLKQIFRESFRELRLFAPMPELEIEFFSFANLNHTIRLRHGTLLVRISDLLDGAPENVLRSVAHILLAKIYRAPINGNHASRYRAYLSSESVLRKAHQIRRLRGSKRILSPHGTTYDLEAIFDDLNRRFFHRLLARPQLAWSGHSARQRLGHYDPAHNAIVVSRVFDHPRVPRYVVEYILYHEMLHLKHPVKLRGKRRSLHSAEFQAEEKLFNRLAAAKDFLKQL
jgi:predicted metal-dependent hydrolase